MSMPHLHLRRFRPGLRSSLLSMTVLACTSHASAQDVPLDIIGESWQYVQNGPISSAYRLGVNVGLNGGEAREYLFDTGSDLFNIDVGADGQSPAWFPGVNTQVPVAQLYPYLYGNGTYGYLVQAAKAQSIQFYNSQTGALAANYNTPQGLPVAAADYDIGTLNSLSGEPGIQINNPTLTSYGYTTQPYYQNLTWQQAINSNQPPEENNFFGTFGAGDFGNGVPGMLTSSGYIVEANGTSTTPGACGPACLIVGLTPALRAQFFSIVPWAAGPQGTFPLSGAQASQEFDTLFTYTLSRSGVSYGASLMTLLDSGTPSIVLTSSDVYQNALTSNHIDPNADPYGTSQTQNSNGNIRPGIGLTVTGTGTGNQSETIATGDDYGGDETNTLTVAPSDTQFNPPSAINGIGFYFRNAVMYDLENAATGYTPFYVTDASFTNGLTVTANMGPLGVAGVISGNAPLDIGAGAIAYLTNANTYTGRTTIAQSGWLGVGGPGSISASSGVQADGTLDLINANHAESIQSLGGSGTVLIGGNTLVLTAAHDTFSGRINNYYTPGSVPGSVPYPVTYQTGSNAPAGGVIIAGGQQTFSGLDSYAGKTGIGENASLVLTGILTSSQVLNAGYFLNNGITEQAVSSTGLIAGHGAFSGGLNVASGVISPGDPDTPAQPGTLRVGMGLTLGQDATYLVHTSGTQSSLIKVDGSATIAGATLAAPATSGTQAPALGQSYTVLTATQGVTGRFGSLDSTLTGQTGQSGQLPFLAPTLSYTPDSVTLDIARSAIRFAQAGQTRNEIATATALDSLSPSLAVTLPLTQLDFAQARQAFRALSGELHASARTALIQDADDIRLAAVDRLRASECAPGAGASTQTASYAGGKRVAEDGRCHSGRSALWMQGYGDWSRNGRTGNASALSNETGGFILGADTTVFRDWHLGGLFGYGHSGFSTRGASASGQSNNFTLGTYGGRRWGKIGLRLGATYTWNVLSMNRNVTYPGFSDRDTNHYGAGTAQAFADLGYRFTFRRFTAEPFANLAYVNQNSQKFNEHGGPSALHGYADDTGVTFSTFGARFASDIAVKSVHLQPSVSVGYRHAFGNVLPVARQSFMVGGNDFEVSGVPLVQDAAIISAGVQTALTRALRISVGYNGQYGSAFTQSGLRGSLNWSF